METLNDLMSIMMESDATIETSIPGPDQQPDASLGILQLPPELLYEIFKNLDYEDLLDIKQVCSYLSNKVEDFKSIHEDIYEEKLEDYYEKYKSRYDDYDDYDDYDSYDSNDEGPLRWSYSRRDYCRNSTPSNSNYDPEEDCWFDLD